MKANYFQFVSQKNFVKLDPRTKIFVLLIINVSAFAISEWYVLALAATVPLSLLILSKRFKITIFFTIFYAFSLMSYVFFIDTKFAAINIISAMLAGVICRMGPGLLMGYYLLSSTTVSEFVASMEKMRLPKALIIPLSVMFRFFPTIKEESSSINDAMKMRGIRFGKSKGSFFAILEYRLIPLFISCIKIGEDLSCSALTRGLSSPVKRTNVCEIGFGVIDFIYLLFTSFVLILFLISKGG
jgi:energy-coupling factor transport system permease protein